MKYYTRELKINQKRSVYALVWECPPIRGGWTNLVKWSDFEGINGLSVPPDVQTWKPTTKCQVRKWLKEHWPEMTIENLPMEEHVVDGDVDDEDYDDDYEDDEDDE